MPAYGSWSIIPSPQVAEILGQSGYDFVLLDMEHGPANVEQAQVMMMAMNGSDTRIIVRVPENSEVWVKRVLDSGAHGVMVPRVENAEQAKAIVEWSYYAPKGKRGDGRRGIRASKWGKNLVPYGIDWNKNGFVAVQIESVEGLKNIEEIASVEGITQLFFGPSDYSADAGISIESEEVLEVAAKIAEVAKAHNLRAGSVTFPLGTVEALTELGYTDISITSDVVTLADGLSETLKSAKG